MEGEAARAADLVLEGGRVTTGVEAGSSLSREADLGGRRVLPGLVNAHDHLDLSTFTPLGHPPYANVYAWTDDVNDRTNAAAVAAAMSVPLSDRLFLGGLRNLLAGVTAVAHHGAFHRALSRPDFPVRVLQKYDFAHSPGLTPALRRTYRTTDRRIPWMVHAGEGTDERCRLELDRLAEANVLRQNTVIVHGIAFGAAEGSRIAEAKACLVWCPEANRRLYGATADVRALRESGVRLGLGSDSPLAGARDALSNLSAARAEGVLDDAELVLLATTGSAAVARLPVGGTVDGNAADLVVVDSMEAWVRGQRRSLALVISGGRPLYGEPALLEALGVPWRPITVEGAPRALEARLAARAAGLLRRHPSLAAVPWLREVSMTAADSAA